MIKLTFITNFTLDLEYIKNEFPFFRKIYNNFNQLVTLYFPECNNYTDNQILKYFLENKKFIEENTKKKGKKLEKDWINKNCNFFEQIEDITGFKWKHKEYKCHLSPSYIIGGAYWRPKTIVIFPAAKHCSPIESIPHELYHLHFWDILEEMEVKDSQKYWDLSEVVVLFVLSELKSKLKVGTELSYLHKEPLKEKLHRNLNYLWKTRKSFEDFLRKSIKIADNFEKSKKSAIAAEFK